MKTDEIEPPQESLQTYLQDDVLFIPSCFFFIRAIAIPEGLIASKIESFLEMTLEGLSPFSLEKLCWGYYLMQTERVAFLYASTTETLKKAWLKTAK